MSLADALANAVTERLQRHDVSAWQKATDVADFQAYLRSVGQPHSTRDLAKVLRVPQTRVAEQLVIAAELNPASLARYKIRPEDLVEAEHRGLLRVAKLQHYLRDKPLRDLVKPTSEPRPVPGSGTPTVRERVRSSVFDKLKDEGHLLIEIPGPIVSLTQREAREYLDEFLPALAHLAEIVKGKKQSHYIALAGNGGIVIYLSPAA